MSADDPRTMRERMLAGELYIADDPELGADAARALALIHRLNTMDPADGPRGRLLTELLGAFGEGSEIRPPFRCDYGYQTFDRRADVRQLRPGSLDVATVTIGDDVQIGPERAAAHPDPPGRAGPAARQVGGGRSRSSSATTCGSAAASSSAPASRSATNTVVGAGAVVTRDLPADVVAVGNPARVVRDRSTPRHDAAPRRRRDSRRYDPTARTASSTRRSGSSPSTASPAPPTA